MGDLPFSTLLARQIKYISFIHRHCRPLARQELCRWERRALLIPDPELRRQALSSLRWKGFHCEAGAIYAAGAPAHSPSLVRAIVTFQTLTDYLDTLSDSHGTSPESVLRRLHAAVADALTPGAHPRAYVSGPDGGYLNALVSETQANLIVLPGYPAVADACRSLGARYIEYQVLKHIPERPAESLATWLAPLEAANHDQRWWEVAAACGSTLGIFALLTAAVAQGAPDATALTKAYFPWVGGLHILLDDFVDQAEDREAGNLNLIRFYRSREEAVNALHAVQTEAMRRVQALPDPALHALVVQGLSGLYLSDPKVARQGLRGAAQRILRGGGPLGWCLSLYCRIAPPLR